MMDMIQANGLAFTAALVAVLLIGWWLLRLATTTPRERHRSPDALDEGAAPAQRNQAFIDAPSASAAAAAIVPSAVSGGMAGIGELIAVAAQDAVEGAREAGDDLSRIKGVGPKLVALLHGLGVTRYAQIAAWTDSDIDRIDSQLGAFAGRARRDSWVEQCALLAGGDTAGYEAKFGKL
jgi:predicted flap endonuclease-1-like 5' DNA nuclease